MNETTFARLLGRLISEIDSHPHREEILRLSLESTEDDLTMGVIMPSEVLQ